MSVARRTTRIIGFALVLFAVTPSAAARASDADDQQQPAAGRSRVRVTVYPILVQAPIFGASFNLPALPSGPDSGGEGGEESNSTDVSLNGAYVGGVTVRANRWFVEAAGTWAALSASRATPTIAVDSDVNFLSARGGVRFFGGFSGTAGFRRSTIDLNLTGTLTRIGRTFAVRTKPVLWDPMFGIDWFQPLGDRWTVEANAQGGGGVGTDVTVSSELRTTWQFVRHFEIRAGYNLIYYKWTTADVEVGSFRRTLISEQTLHGPQIGFGIVF